MLSGSGLTHVWEPLPVWTLASICLGHSAQSYCYFFDLPVLVSFPFGTLVWCTAVCTLVAYAAFYSGLLGLHSPTVYCLFSCHCFVLCFICKGLISEPKVCLIMFHPCPESQLWITNVLFQSSVVLGFRYSHCPCFFPQKQIITQIH